MRPNTLVTKILDLAREDPQLLEQLERFRRAITVMFTDIKGSTEYFEHYGDIAGLAMVHECNDALRQVVEQHEGRVIKTIGDAIMAVFDDCDQSVRAAIEMQRRLRQKNAVRKKQDEMLIRIGLHHGLGIVKSDDVFGDVVNVASRVESMAQPEQIIVSDSLSEKISRSEFTLMPLGRFHLRGKSGDRDLFQVIWNGQDAVPLKAAHTTITGTKVLTAKLQRLTRDGSVSAEYAVTPEGITVDNRPMDAKSSGEPASRALQARFFLLDGQPTVEDVGNRGRILVRLLGTYTLQDGDRVAMGKHMFKFRCDSEVLSAATALGKTLLNVNDLLQEPAAHFVSVTMDGNESTAGFPLEKEETTFGRTNATYAFSDDLLMSRSHARVYHRGADFFLEDLGSRNGTFVVVRGRSPVPFGGVVVVGGQPFRLLQ